jgi:20S proteasome alpha/beta subunit
LSLIIGVYVPTGIVISGDSKTTGTIQEQESNPHVVGQNITVQTNIKLSDSTEKVFKLFDRFGVATFGDAQINNLPIAHYVEQFEAVINLIPPVTTVGLVILLLEYFRQLNPNLRTGLIVAGNDNNTPHVYGVDIFGNTWTRHNIIPDTQTILYGIVRGGDTDIVNRLLNNQQLIPPFEVMSLQDAVDFSRHLIRATIDQMRFEPKFPKVGGEIDTLVITSKSVLFLQHKSLKCI